ncbi:MAG: hypothetical protein IJC71_00570 [Clostridia bacterium]|nr:hypothetical protein [Clostridia bacterium]
MTQRENMLRTIRFEHPDFIPIRFAISGDVFRNYDPHALAEVLEKHPIVAGKHRMRWDLVPKEGEKINQPKDYTDAFGVKWKGALDGIRGVVQEHPLADLTKVKDYKFPAHPNFNLEADRERVAKAKEAGHFTGAGLEHGHTFLRITDLVGYETTLLAMADEDENMKLLIEKLEEYNFAFVDHWSKCGYDQIGYAEDLGMQVGPMISPQMLRDWIKPSYQRLMKPARDAGAIIQMHSDGDIRTLADDLIDAGVDILNLQDLVNGIDWIKDRFAGKKCIDLDIDRQNITVFGTPAQVDALLREEIEKLSSPAGGLMMVYGWYAGTPLENIDALLTAMEKYMYYWS